jgi:hypothetical protein
MTAPNISWLHINQTANERGLVAQEVSGDTGSRILLYGGFATGTEEGGGSNPNRNATAAGNGTAATPLCGSSIDYDSGADRDAVTMTFAAPPGAYVRLHLWIITA